MQIRVRECELFLTNCRARMPFRFGAHTLTWAPLATARMLVEDESGRASAGFSSDFLMPKWFEKDPEKSVYDDLQALRESARAGARAYIDAGHGFASAFSHWWDVYRACVGRPPRDPAKSLVDGFGVALFERALLDATARAAGTSFFRALVDDRFGFRPAEVHPELLGWRLAASLSALPSREILVRHTIGLLDPLRVSDIHPRDHVDDGFPEALEDDVRRHGLSAFKIKLTGRVDYDLFRLEEIAAVLEQCGVAHPRLTLDGNEQLADEDALRALLGALAQRSWTRGMLGRIEYVEQPFERLASFTRRVAQGLRAMGSAPAVIVDEADFGVDAFREAIACGYRGVSVKGCKGVFRSLLNRGLADLAGPGFFQTAEDLTCVPVLALQQDLTVAAALELPHAERNGHHYFRALAHLPPAEAEEALAKHPDLYEDARDGPRLSIRAGKLALGSLQCTGFGYDVAIRTATRTPERDWRPW